ncbi:SDR family NAD(P)-dependent oxidoreductase [Streptomyces halstedii]|uniref:SDR family NAD(P)-dependent oxidoreductase n=1 Tax=Streptomyces halstedii TaxID=1944 RepID=A0ABS6U236_STRHA|nr:SDR family NAD(P)-dependent oxidoreductase [Streptomyces halstedii]MBV7674346.1 SDR family NAD(P)-dependent oxidoreductase [Streptomyces halstedii]
MTPSNRRCSWAGPVSSTQDDASGGAAPRPRRGPLTRKDGLRILLRARDTDTVAATAELPHEESPDADGQIRDVHSTEQVDAAVRAAAADRYGPVDALVNNTGRQRRREAPPTD